MLTSLRKLLSTIHLSSINFIRYLESSKIGPLLFTSVYYLQLPTSHYYLSLTDLGTTEIPTLRFPKLARMRNVELELQTFELQIESRK